MLTRHMHTTLAAALIAVGSSVTLADPAAIAATPGSTAYRLKVDTAAEIDSQMYKLTEKSRSAAQRAKDAARAGRAKRPSAMLVPNSSLPDQDITKFTDQNKLADLPFAREIGLAATAAALDPALVHAVIYVESRYRQNAISPKGAIGLMQVLPDTAARYGIKDPSRSAQINLKAGTLYLRDLLRMFDN
ncbi:MAG TPA: lytic transglycosylase domain-containing protein, partial [Methylophilaceae bacterium]|nr:lytic transglycosylase domain-containing protein [Methylophilaceae bacterium]